MTVAPILALAESTNVESKFATFTYTAKGTGEVTMFRLILGESTESLYQKDIAALTTLIPMLSGLEKEAAEAILASRQKSLEVGIGHNPAYTCADTYTAMQGFPNVRIHKAKGEMYISGLVEDKTVLSAGTYKTVNSAPLTIAKRKLEKVLPSGRFRLFTLPNVGAITVDGDTLVIE